MRKSPPDRAAGPGFSRRSLLLGLGLLGNLLTFIGDFHLGSEALVVLILHNFANVDISGLEMQGVISLGVGWKPVLAVNLLPPSGEFGEEVFIVLATDIGHRFAKGLNNLKVAVIHPYAPLEISFSLFDLFGSD